MIPLALCNSLMTTSLHQQTGVDDMNKVQFEQRKGAVKGYFHVKWTVTPENALHRFDVGVIESPAMNIEEIGENLDFFKNQGYQIERV